MKATVRKEYKIRLVLIAAMCLGWAALCVYDATVKYPEQIKAYDRYIELSQSGIDGWQGTWNTEATTHGWELNPTKRASKDILTQWVMFWLTLPIGVYFVIALMRSMGQYVEMKDETLSSHTVQDVGFNQITELDKRLWDKKGIAFAVYDTDGNGATGRIKLDDWIYDRQKIRDMVKELDEYMNPGGVEEVEKDEASANLEDGE